MLDWTASDSISPTWHKLKKHFEALRDIERKRNDSPLYDALQTAGIRGRIGTLSDMIELDKTVSPEHDRLSHD